MSTTVPLLAILTSGGQASYDFSGRTNDGSAFGPGQKVLIGPYTHTNVATSQTAQVAALGGVAANPATGRSDWVAPYPGVIIASSVCLGTAFTGGTPKYVVAINGTTNATLRLLPTAAAGTLSAYTKVARSSGIAFAAGDKIGVKHDTGTAPATVEGYVMLVAEI